jgi:hypothetical protein
MGPFEEHLRDAIRINRERMSLYSRVSGGRSKSVSMALIFSELMTIPSSKIPDLWARYFIKRGIPIVQEEFISMSHAKTFSERFGFDPEPIELFFRSDASGISRRIRKAYKTGGFERASEQIRIELNPLNQIKTYHFMMKHLLESMLRISSLAPFHEKKRKELGLRYSTLPLSRYLFHSHFLALGFSSWLDLKAAPIQAMGIPIIANDVPPIPEHSDFYLKINKHS